MSSKLIEFGLDSLPFATWWTWAITAKLSQIPSFENISDQ
jgi:hypothetical protein